MTGALKFSQSASTSLCAPVRAGPVTVRNFSTDGSSSYLPGDRWVLRGLLSITRQTSNTPAWYENDIIRREVPEIFFALGVPSDGAVNSYAARENLFELRRITGFTWDELAQFIGVDRRSLHNWAQGGAVRIDNRKRLADALRLMYYIDRGTCEANRVALHDATRVGLTAVQLAAQGRLAEARIAAGKGKGRPLVAFPSLESGAAARLGPIGIGFFTGEDPTIDPESSEPPVRKASSRRIPLKRS